MHYTLEADLPDDTNPEGIARTLEKAAAQVRMMSSAHAAHSMACTAMGGEATVRHGVSRNTGTDTPG